MATSPNNSPYSSSSAYSPYSSHLGAERCMRAPQRVGNTMPSLTQITLEPIHLCFKTSSATFTPPTSVPAGIETPMTTKISAHDHVYSNSVPCRDLPATSPLCGPLIQTDANTLAQSACSCSDLLNQRISHFKNIHRKLHQHITIGKHQITLPPAPAPAPAPAGSRREQ